MLDFKQKIIFGVSIVAIFGLLLAIIKLALLPNPKSPFSIEPVYNNDDDELLADLKIFTTTDNDMAVKFAGHLEINSNDQSDKQYLPIDLQNISKDPNSDKIVAFNLSSASTSLYYVFKRANHGIFNDKTYRLIKIEARLKTPDGQDMACKIVILSANPIEFKLNRFKCSLKKYQDCMDSKSELIAKLYIRMIKFEMQRSTGSDRKKFEFESPEICKYSD